MKYEGELFPGNVTALKEDGVSAVTEHAGGWFWPKIPCVDSFNDYSIVNACNVVITEIIDESINDNGEDDSKKFVDEGIDRPNECDSTITGTKGKAVPTHIDGCLNEKNKVCSKKLLGKRNDQNKEKHTLLPGSCKCKENCKNIIDDNERINIHTEFWKLAYNQRKLFIFNMINVANIARPHKITQGKRERKHTYNYSFKKGGLSVPVCQRFFLNTLGFKSHQVLKTVMKDYSFIVPEQDR